MKAEARLSKTQESKRDNKQPIGKQHGKVFGSPSLKKRNKISDLYDDNKKKTAYNKLSFKIIINLIICGVSDFNYFFFPTHIINLAHFCIINETNST